MTARVVQNLPDFLRQARQRVVYAPWLITNIHIAKPLHDRPSPHWDNVVYSGASSSGGLGYVDAMHQSLNSAPSATVLTH